MGFKKTTRSLDFADLASGQLPGTKPLHQAHRAAQRHHQLVSEEVARAAYPPLMLFKCLLLQKWFRIQSDTELEDQINDRLSVKSVLGLSFSQPVPDHSTFSRFRGRLSKEAMDQINSEILRQFEQQGLSINEGVAVDARLVKSASRPLSQDELKKQRERRQTEDGNRDKNGSRLSSRGILSPTGPFAMIDLISGLKSMPQ